MGVGRTRRQALLQPVGLLSVVEHKSVQVSATSELELDGGLGVLLDTGGYQVERNNPSELRS